ncbi:MAG: VWA domain-containing protein [Planctomycetes bacterium]|nr:VWA domain-containing protein [Planctomycetota bacterium]
MKGTRSVSNRTRILVGLGVAVIALAVGLLPGGRAGAAGLLIADGGLGGVLEIEEHAVQVTINNGIAVTRVTQVFRNKEDRQVEALYTFPVPRGASVSNFSMWINGKEMVGEVVEKARAREIYESYKRRRVDPGLLEQVDYKTFEMRIFPVPPKGAQRVEITYYQELDFDDDWATYVYPLATSTRREIDTRARGRFALRLEARSAVPIARMESPSHPGDFVIADHAETYCEASLETPGGDLERDVVVAYQVKRRESGIDVIASKEQGEDGTFCMTITAGDDLEAVTTGMDYVFILDVSGSMAYDGKMIVSRDAIAAFLKALSPEDRFEILVFNVRPAALFGSLADADDAARKRAEAFLDGQEARGGTILGPALDVAYRYRHPDRTLNVVVLSDGMTEQNERDSLFARIRTRPINARVFCVGVGNDVNRPLLEKLAGDAGGLSSFVSRADDFERQAKAFRRKLVRPVATLLDIDFGKAQVYDVEPKTLPNLFHGWPVRIYGRYRGDGPTDVTLIGTMLGKEMRRSFHVIFPARDDRNPEIERMWAWHRMDRLQKGIDASPDREASIREIVRLGEGYSIAGEYTSFLVLENDAEYKRWKIERRNALRIGRDRASQERLAEKLRQMRDEALAALGPQPEGGEGTRETARGTDTASAPRTTSAPAHAPSGGSSGSPLFGGGPVGPVMVALLAWLERRRKRSRAEA